jgi:hypothetical protein
MALLMQPMETKQLLLIEPQFIKNPFLRTLGEVVACREGGTTPSYGKL